MPELIPRVATALHVFNQPMEALLAGAPASSPPTEITKTTLESAMEFVHHLEGKARPEGHSLSAEILCF